MTTFIFQLTGCCNSIISVATFFINDYLPCIFLATKLTNKKQMAKLIYNKPVTSQPGWK